MSAVRRPTLTLLLLLLLVDGLGAEEEKEEEEAAGLGAAVLVLDEWNRWQDGVRPRRKEWEMRGEARIVGDRRDGVGGGAEGGGRWAEVNRARPLRVKDTDEWREADRGMGDEVAEMRCEARAAYLRAPHASAAVDRAIVSALCSGEDELRLELGRC